MAEIYLYHPKTNKYETRRGTLYAWWCFAKRGRGVNVSVDTRKDGASDSLYFTRIEARKVLKAIQECLAGKRA